MLRLSKLEIDNFGPFKGFQTLTFPPSGVTIIYGENMRGKTKLLNAVRYALFGKVLTRSSREEPLYQVGNWEAAKEEVFGFSVKLHFVNNDRQYVLTRNLVPKRGIALPNNENDYVEEFFLKRDDVMLGPEERDREISQIMPEQVSRFFLFDGELLQEYEELLRDDSKMGVRITESIERILGVPILINARTDLRELHFDAQRQASKAAQHNKKTQELGNNLEFLTEQRKHLQDERDRFRNDLSQLESEKATLEQKLRRSERIKTFLDDIEKEKDERELLAQRLDDKRERLKDEMSAIWRRLLSGRASQEQKVLQQQQSAIQDQITQITIAAQVQQALTDSVCSVCGQTLTDRVKLELEEKLNNIQGGFDPEQAAEALRDITYRIQTLQQFSEPLSPRTIADISNDIDRIVVEIASKTDRIQELEGYVADYDQSEIRAMYSTYDRLVKEIGTLENGIEETDRKIVTINEDVRKLEAKIRQATGADPIRETRKSDLYLSLYKLFEMGVDVYRDQLREQVEQDATKLFLKLTSEPEYRRLEISPNYGLHIIHEDGSEIPIRSAGAEHIVALSLMGALQKNAPLQGPIIMDSPFGRLDATHTDNVIGALPEMADQIVLLVYKSELNPDRARSILGRHLEAEYRLERKSARHTLLVPYLE